MAKRTKQAVRVGLLMLAALVVLAAGIFTIGEKDNLFRAKSSYYTRFPNVSGLNPGNPVQLNGVDVGTVTGVTLPLNPDDSAIRVDLDIDRRYADRVREDSSAQIKTLGLLGDKYVELTSGSVQYAVIPAGSEIPSAAGGMDQLMETGEDVMANITEISSSLKSVLARMESGEGLLGQLIADPESGRQMSDAILETLDSVQQTARQIESGDGTLPRLINDPALADRLEATVGRLDAVLAKVETGDGLLPALLNDPETRERFEGTLASFEDATGDLASFTRDLSEGQGLLPKLMTDEEYGREMADELKTIVERLNLLTAKLTEGNGTVARLVDDPGVYEAINDILVGINESRMLRWLIRNRQKAGIDRRYEETVEGGENPATSVPRP